MSAIVLPNRRGASELPDRLTQGREQTIAFAPLEPIDAAIGSTELRATSSAGLPVHFYVESGPAIIEGNKLRLAQIPKCPGGRCRLQSWLGNTAAAPSSRWSKPPRRSGRLFWSDNKQISGERCPDIGR